MENYTLDRVLGRGGEGTVWLVTRKDTQQKLVLKKRTFTDLAAANRGLQEAMTLCRFHSDYVVKCDEVFLDLELMQGVQLYHICLVMQYCEAGDLCHRVAECGSSLEPKLVMNWVRHLCEGLKMIHHGGLVHRDIKLENVFLDSCGNALIGDFGLATASVQPPVCARASIEATPIGTAAYNAPELWAPLVKRVPGKEVDIWALGCVFYELASGKLLVQRESSIGEQVAALGLGPISALLEDIPQTFANLKPVIAAMLNPDPLHRPSIDSLLTTFGHVLSSQGRQSLTSTEIVADSVRGGIVRSLAEPHKQQILELWASAFSLVEGEFYNFHAEAATRYRMLREFFGPVSSALLHSSRLGFGYFKDDGLLGMSYWSRPGQYRVSRRKVFKEVEFVIPKDPIPALKLLQYGHRSKQIQRYVQRNLKHCWGLLTIAVRPLAQHKGIGSYLLSEGLQMMDMDGTACFGVAQSAVAEAFLSKHGFRTAKKFDLKPYPALIMVREPNPRDATVSPAAAAPTSTTTTRARAAATTTTTPSDAASSAPARATSAGSTSRWMAASATPTPARTWLDANTEGASVRRLWLDAPTSSNTASVSEDASSSDDDEGSDVYEDTSDELA